MTTRNSVRKTIWILVFLTTASMLFQESECTNENESYKNGQKNGGLVSIKKRSPPVPASYHHNLYHLRQQLEPHQPSPSLLHPTILTKFTRVTAFERQTIILPCVILNLPNDMHVIWQYGKRGEVNQTVLSVGGTQVESNYRLRVISNSSSLSSISDDDPFDSEPARSRITVNNLEIRRLQLSDSGWYECQLPTKPTQINYIHLEVLGIPKIEASPKHPEEGQAVELICQVRNLPARFELSWYLNDRKLNPQTTILNGVDDETSQHQSVSASSNYVLIPTTTTLPINGRHVRLDSIDSSDIRSASSSPGHHESLTAVVDRVHNVTMSRLKIKPLDWYHKGVYKCRYDQVEAFYNLDFESNPMSRNHAFDLLLSRNDASASVYLFKSRRVSSTKFYNDFIITRLFQLAFTSCSSFVFYCCCFCHHFILLILFSLLFVSSF